MIVPTLPQNQRDHAAVADAEQAPLPPDPRRASTRGAAPGSGSKAPGGRGEVAGQEGEAGVEVVAGQVGHRAGASDQGEGVVDRPLAAAGHADQLLAEHVERCPDRSQRLDPALSRRPPP